MQITNYLRIIGEPAEIKRVKDFITTDGTIDFNKIIPKPSSLLIESNTSMEKLAYCKLMQEFFESIKNLYKFDWDDTQLKMMLDSEIEKTTKDLDEDSLKIVKKLIQNYKECGQLTNAGWSIVNWGTINNAIPNKNHFNESELYFITESNPPIPVIKKLSEMFSKTEFNLKYADEKGEISGFGMFFKGRGKIEELKGTEATELFSEITK